MEEVETKALTSRKEVRALVSTSFVDDTWVRTKTKEVKSFTDHVNAVDHNIKCIHVGNILAIARYYKRETNPRPPLIPWRDEGKEREEPHQEISEKVGFLRLGNTPTFK